VGGYIWEGAAIQEDRVYLPGREVRCIGLSDGEVLWKTPEIKAFGTCPSLMADRILVCTFDGIVCLNIENGEPMYQIPPGSREVSPCVINDRVFWSGVDGRIHAVDITTGEKLWESSITSDDAIRFSLCSDGEAIFFADNYGVYSLSTSSGETLWSWNNGGSPVEPLKSGSIVDEVLLIPSKVLGILGINKDDGKEIWRTSLSSGPFTGICADPEAGIAYVGGRSLISISTLGGIQNWSSAEFGFKNSTPIIVGDFIFVGGGFDRFVYGFNRANGEKVWEFPTSDMVYSTPSFAQGRLLIGCHDGYLYCFGQDL
jgi:outer membrane protein assembly factor BamB